LPSSFSFFFEFLRQTFRSHIDLGRVFFVCKNSLVLWRNN
jgi:hypothetical protein